MTYQIIVLRHEDGERLPMLVSPNGLPVIEPNIFALTQRGLAWRSIEKKLRAIARVHLWADKNEFDLTERILSGRLFSESEINGSLLPALRRSHQKRKVQQLVVAAKTYNALVMYVKEYLVWRINSHLVKLSASDSRFQAIEKKLRVIINWLEDAVLSMSSARNEVSKGLTHEQLHLLLALTHPDYSGNSWRSVDIRHRNHLIIHLLLCGLRPAELQTLRVEDLLIGAISAIQVKRRPHDHEDPRLKSPEVKRSGRLIPIVDSQFVRLIDHYIMKWRPRFEDRNASGSDYLILSDEGNPLSYSSIAEIFSTLKQQDQRLPRNFSAKTLRHCFSGSMERKLRYSGIEEDRRKEILAYLRGDSDLESQQVYIQEEIKEQARIALQRHQADIFQSTSSLEDVPF
ncbi:MAG TPA: site-specific integrase [Gallionellaceae bacterium]|nr:site-specific integrase [Gallionellaceae bacterium]